MEKKHHYINPTDEVMATLIEEETYQCLTKDGGRVFVKYRDYGFNGIHSDIRFDNIEFILLPVSPNVSKVEDWDEVLKRFNDGCQDDSYNNLFYFVQFLKLYYSIPVSPTDKKIESVFRKFLNNWSDDNVLPDAVFKMGVDDIRSLFNTPSERKTSERVESKYVWFIENENQEWLYNEMDLSDLNEPKYKQLFTKKPLQALTFTKKMDAENHIKYFLYDKSTKDKLKVTEHEFVSHPSPPMEKQISEVEAVTITADEFSELQYYKADFEANKDKCFTKKEVEMVVAEIIDQVQGGASYSDIIQILIDFNK